MPNLTPLNQQIIIGEAEIKMPDGSTQKVPVKPTKQFLDDLNKIIREIVGG